MKGNDSSAPKYEDRPQEDILRRERCAWRDALEMVKGVLKLKEMALLHSSRLRMFGA